MYEAIKNILTNKRAYEAEHCFLLSCCQGRENRLSLKQSERLAELEENLNCIDAWMKLLSDDEAFVVRRHLIDGIDISRIVVEYGEKWGAEFAKTDRTIKTYQQRALVKIEEFEKHKSQLMEE